MSFLESVLLGIVQGFTEFLPVSSSAHLKIAKFFLNVQESDASVLLDLSCHLGTLMALMLFLRKDIRDILKNKRQILLFLLALCPLVPCYFLLKPLRDLASSRDFLGPCLMGTGLILLAGQSLRMSRSEVKTATPKIQDVLMIGTLQSAALIPGISRSAATISCARVLGWSAKEAVRFSFLLSIPTVIGGNLIELLKAASFSQPEVRVPFFGLFAAFGSAFFIGFFVVKKAMRYLEKGNLKPFAWYALSLGTLVTLYFIEV
jgi:undecaprenyl-diphosphatase